MKRYLHILPIIAILLIFVSTGLAGIDFGFHWDENQQFILIRDSLEAGIFLPGWYKYPSVTYWLSMAGNLPHAILASPQVGGDWQALFAHLIEVTNTPAYLLQVRTIFLVVSALSLVWVYLQPLAWSRSWLEGFAGAAILGLSWEIAYHARWIAPDTVLMQFAALTILCATMAISKPSQKYWLVGSAVSAGLACGTKYPGGLLITLPLIAAYHIQTTRILSEQQSSISTDVEVRENSPRTQVLAGWRIPKIFSLIRTMTLILIVFIAAYLVSTPGTLLEPIRFYKTVSYELQHYSSGFSEQIIQPGLPHMGRMLNYIFQVLFSHFRPVAWLLSLMSGVGAFALYKNSRPIFALLTLFPALYLLYFSTQSVMRARNLLVLAPFLAILSAHGLVYIREMLPNKLFARLWLALIACIFVVNAIWLGWAAWSIQNRSPERFSAKMVNYIDKNPSDKFWASPNVWEQSQILSNKPPNNLSPLPPDDDGYLVFYASEGMQNPNDWPGNQPQLAAHIFGPWEVNFNYYPRWAGEDRILVMRLDQARRIGIQLVP